MPRRPPGLKARLWAAATGHIRLPCHWCRQHFAYAEMVADHEPPLAAGGTPHSAVLACVACDARRSKETNDRVNAARRGKARRRRKRR